MALARVSRNTLREQVYESLRDEIVSGGWEVGSRLPSMKQLADVFGTSINPVQMALERLEEEGYVVKSHGSGTYVADRESTAGGASVAVCLRARAHLDSELTMNMARELHRVGTSPIVVDIDEPASAELMTELARSGVEIFVLKGHSHSQFGLLERDVFQGKTVVAVIEWEGPEREDLYRVMSDHAAAGRQVARYLWERGHRRVLLIAPGMEKIIQTAGSSSQRTGQLKAFSRELGRLGGEWTAIRSDASGVQEGELVAVEEEKLVKKLSGENACTAIFGFRDVEAAAAQ
ncbi:MAG: GntR family transcriptional regulator, partial [Planctomycetes bacterium]|nr:GntR family transcriptional regulator [Planctomycetota bacterium]